MRQRRGARRAEMGSYCLDLPLSYAPGASRHLSDSSRVSHTAFLDLTEKSLFNELANMPINLKPRAPLPPFTFSPSPPAPSISHDTDAPKPPTDLFPERDMVIFGSMPLASRWAAGRRLIRCQKCERPCPESNWENHQR